MSIIRSTPILIYLPAAEDLNSVQAKIENNLIHYLRDDEQDARVSDVSLAAVDDAEGLQTTLDRALGTFKVVDKIREIYFIDNVKFHLDQVELLGEFVEIEAIAPVEDYPIEKLEDQCRHYMEMFGIEKEDIISESYSDMM